MENDGEKNSRCRKIRIRNFRNFGREGVDMTLNRSIDCDRLGGVVFVVGPNNCGKTNVLDAICKLPDPTFGPDDIPDYPLDGDPGEPEVRLIVMDGKEIDPTSECLKESYERWKGMDFSSFRKRSCEALSALVSQEKFPDRAGSLLKNIDSVSDAFLAESMASLISKKDVHGILEEAGHDVQALDSDLALLFPPGSDPESWFERTYGYPYRPNVIRYEESRHRQSDLRCGYDDYGGIVAKILLYVRGGPYIVERAHGEHIRKGTTGPLTAAEDYLNEGIRPLADRFNELYRVGSYSFRIRLLEELISFEIHQGGIPIDLDRQSSGFRWFFDFFFDVLCVRSLDRGDIVVMDEPAANIHALGQSELAGFIRQFSVDKGITFVISTHSPFLVSCDNLDELRILAPDEGGHAKIHDKFTVIDTENPDQLDGILKGFTVSRHVLFDPNERTVFVEGITDYNYLTAFKILFGVKGITFLPINGIKDTEKVVDKVRTLSRNPLMLVDGDIPGNILHGYAKNRDVEVVRLSDIDPRFYDIESVFTHSDRREFDIGSKEWHASSVFKQYIRQNSGRLSNRTKSNFRKILDYLMYGGPTEPLERSYKHYFQPAVGDAVGVVVFRAFEGYPLIQVLEPEDPAVAGDPVRVLAEDHEAAIHRYAHRIISGEEEPGFHLVLGYPADDRPCGRAVHSGFFGCLQCHAQPIALRFQRDDAGFGAGQLRFQLGCLRFCGLGQRSVLGFQALYLPF